MLRNPQHEPHDPRHETERLVPFEHESPLDELMVLAELARIDRQNNNQPDADADAGLLPFLFSTQTPVVPAPAPAPRPVASVIPDPDTWNPFPCADSSKSRLYFVLLSRLKRLKQKDPRDVFSEDMCLGRMNFYEQHIMCSDD